MRAINKSIKRRGLSARTRLKELQAGFTIVSTMVSVVVGSVAILGGWVAFRDIQMQWRISHAERLMDQYAHNALAEMVNVISWSYGAQQTAGGRHTRFEFALMDQVLEHSGQHGPGLQSYRYPADGYFLLRNVNGGIVELSYADDEGILFDRRAPGWAKNTRGRDSWYTWDGRRSRGGDRQNTYDRRDRMSVAGFEIDFPLTDELAIENLVDKFAVIQVTMTMQYRYDASDGVSLFTDEYVRERVYSTKIFCRNWDVENNLYRKDLVETALFGG